MKEVRCYNCQGFGHYARDCRRKKETRAKDGDEMQYAHVKDNDYEHVILMANTQSKTGKTNMWYLDYGCSNHITSNKDWFTKLDESIEKVIKFADGRHITSGGKGAIFVVRKDGRKVNIIDMLYVSSMISSLTSIGQLLAKGYNMKIEKNHMKVYHSDGRLILKTPLADNEIFKVEINRVNRKCLLRLQKKTRIGYCITSMDI